MGLSCCWLLHESRKVLQVWPYDGVLMPTSLSVPPAVLHISNSEACAELFVSEVVPGCLAVCTDSGHISTSDRSVEFQLFANDSDASQRTVTCFACARSDFLTSVLGTRDGCVIADVKFEGSHYTTEIRLNQPGDLAASSPRRWWSSVMRYVSGGSGEKNAAGEGSGSMHHPGGCERVLIRRQRPLDLVAATASSVHGFSLSLSGNELSARRAWTAPIPRGHERHEETAARVLGLAESDVKVAVLLLRDQPPSLTLTLLDGACGELLFHKDLNASLDVLKAAATTREAAVHISDDLVLICFSSVVLAVTTSVDARQSCSLEWSLSLNALHHTALASSIVGNGSVVTLTHSGPQLAVKNVFDELDGSLSPPPTDGNVAPAAFLGSRREGQDMEAYLRNLLRDSVMDQNITLDDRVMRASEELYGYPSPTASHWWSAPHQQDAEYGNTILRVTMQLRKRQQTHRRFLIELMGRNEIVTKISPYTLATVISAQESLLSLCSLRALGVESLASSESGTAFQFVEALLPSRLEEYAELSQVHLLQTPSQFELCQQILHNAVIAAAARARATNSEWANATAAEIAFSHPTFCLELLSSALQFAADVMRSADPPSYKWEVLHASACLFVIVAQTITESREDLNRAFPTKPEVEALLWTTANTPLPWGLHAVFSQFCTLLGSSWGVDMQLPPPDHAQVNRLELVQYLLFFSLSCCSTAADAQDYFTRIIRSSLLRGPFVCEPYGYPLGPPSPHPRHRSLGLRAVEAAEHLSLTFGVYEILVDLSLSTPVEDPTNNVAAYNRFAFYCQQNDGFFEYAMHRLLSQQREWELLSLPSVLPDGARAAAQRDHFLTMYAPQLLWIASSNRCDSLMTEASNPLSYVNYGPTPLSHRSRCSSLARLAYIAIGSPKGSGVGCSLAQASAVLDAQKEFFAASEKQFYGPQEMVQQLLALEGSVKAWQSAAGIASLTPPPLSEDLLSQVLRRAKGADKDSLLGCVRDNRCVSEQEVSRYLSRTVTGQVMLSCRELQSLSLFNRLSLTFLCEEERELLSAWVEALWCGRVNGGSA